MIYVVYGHSGSGKSTLVDNLARSNIIPRVKTYTTRPKRYDCENDYNYISHIEFTKMEKANLLVGVRAFTVYVGGDTDIYRYGIPIEELRPYANLHKHCTIVTDASGVDLLFETFGKDNVVAVYMYGSKDLLKSRAKKRLDYNEREWERRYKADNSTLSGEEFDRYAMGDKFITGYRYYLVDISLPPNSQKEYFEEVILNG